MSELLRLQTEFYTRLTEETLKYLRRMQAAWLPATPGTVLLPRGSLQLEASGAPGESVEVQLEVENRQRVHCVVTPMLTPFVHVSGATWFPSAAQQGSMLLAPDQVETVKMQLRLPAEMPGGVFRGALLLQGFSENAIPIAITVAERAPEPAPESRAARGRKPPAATTAARSSPTEAPAEARRKAPKPKRGKGVKR